MSANKAHGMGLVNQVVAPEELLPTAVGIAKKLGANNGDTMRLMKHIMNEPLRSQLDEILENVRAA